MMQNKYNFLTWKKKNEANILKLPLRGKRESEHYYFKKKQLLIDSTSLFAKNLLARQQRADSQE